MHIKIPLFIFTCLGALLIWNQSLQASIEEHISAKSPENPVVIELFTSQSCSSCPPADRMLGELADKPGVISLAFHVTYWDHLNWKDTLSKQFATDRQHDYSDKAGGRRVYTPQMIVNGTTQFVGSNKDSLEKALREARTISPVTIQRDRNYLNVSLPTIQNFKGRANVWMFAVQSDITQTIPAGENKGKTVHYSNAVLYEKSLGDWNGMNKIISAPVPNIVEADTIVVLVQYDDHGPIVAAGKQAL